MQPLAGGSNQLPKLDISKIQEADFEKISGLKGAIAATSSSITYQPIQFKNKVLLYSTADLYKVIFKRMLTSMPLERSVDGTANLMPKDPLVEMKTRFLVEMLGDAIIKKLCEKCPTHEEDIRNNVEFSQTSGMDMLDILQDLIKFKRVTQQDVDAVIKSTLYAGYDQTTPATTTLIHEYLEKFYFTSAREKSLLDQFSAMSKEKTFNEKMIAKYITGSSQTLMQGPIGHFIDELGNSRITKAIELFANMSKEERAEAGKILTNYVTLGQVNDFSVNLNNMATRFHADKEMFAGKSRDDKFWTDLEGDRKALFAVYTKTRSSL